MSDGSREKTRDRVQALIEEELRGDLDADQRAWLETHRADFPEYAEILEALDGQGPLWSELDEGPPATPPLGLRAREQVKAHLAGEPVEALPMANGPRIGVIALTAAAVVLMLVALGVRSDMQERSWYEVVLPGALLVGGFFIAMSSFDHLRRRGYLGASIAVMIGAPLLFIGVSLALRATPHSHVAHSFLGPALGCGSAGLLIGLLALVPAIVLARRGMAGPSQLSALLLGITAASVGVGALHLRCSMVDLSHVIVGHGLLFVLIPLAALLLRSVRRLT